MARGRKTGGRQPGSVNKVTADVRAAFAELLQANAAKLNGWLTRVGRDDPGRALDIVAKLAEYHIPKLTRTELSGPSGGPIRMVSADKNDQAL